MASKIHYKHARNLIQFEWFFIEMCLAIPTFFYMCLGTCARGMKDRDHVIKFSPKSVPTPSVYICVCVCVISVWVCVNAHHQTLYNFISDDFKVSHQKKICLKKIVGSKINFVNKNYGQQKFLGQQNFLKKKLWWIFFCCWNNFV